MKRHILRTLILFCCFLSIGTLTVSAQQLSLAGLRSKVMDALEKAPTADGTKAISKKYCAAILDRWGEKEKIPALKAELQGDLQTFAEKSSSGYATFLDVLFDELKERCAANESVPVLEYNLVLTIGELNSSQKRGEPTVAYAKARPFLKEMLSSKKVHLRIAGLKGLARHAECGLKSTEEKADLAKIFSQYAFAPLTKGEANEAPETEWCRLMSLAALGNVGYAGKNGEIAAKLLESAETQNKQLTSPIFRHDMERRITAALAFSKISLSPDVLKAMGKKPADVTASLGKLFLQCMIYEYDHDYDLQEGIEGEEDRNIQSRRAAIQRTMSPEEELYQIRLWKQRTKSISIVFQEIFGGRQSSIPNMEAGNTNYRKIASKVREISMMYDSLGLSKKRTSSKRNDEMMEDPAMMSPEIPMGNDEKISLYKLQKDMRSQLNELADLLGITVTIKAKRRPMSDMGY